MQSGEEERMLNVSLLSSVSSGIFNAGGLHHKLIY